MPRPGTDVALLETPGILSTATDTGVWFVTGLTDRGPANTPKLIQSLSQFVTLFGDRQSYSVLYDCIEEYFREGGNKVYISRAVGPGATTGTKNLMDNGAAVSLVVNAIGPGAWSSSYKVAVYSATSGYGLQILDANNNVVEDSGGLATQDAAVQWSLNSNYVSITKGVSANNPQVAAASALSAGNDQRGAITDTEWQTALDKFTKDMGPGQVSAPGQTSTTRHSSLVSHAYANNRVALLDLTDSAVVATLTGNIPTYSTSTRFSAAFAPWLIIPGISGSVNRTIPPSPLIAGLIAKNDGTIGSDAASAGKNGISNYAIDLSQINWTDADRSTLNLAGVNLVRRMFGSIRNYGWRSLANPTTDPNWIDFGNARLFMDLVAELNMVGENFMFSNIDGQNGTTINQFHDALAGVLLDHYNQGDLFGDTPDQSFAVDTGPGVNTLQTIANLELHAVVQVRMTPFAEWVQIQIVKRQTADVIQ